MQMMSQLQKLKTAILSEGGTATAEFVTICRSDGLIQDWVKYLEKNKTN